MESKNHSYITNIQFKFNSLEKTSTIIPIKTINNYECVPFTKQIIIYDFNKDKNNSEFNNKIDFVDNISSVNKITFDNKDYLYISGNLTELYLIEKDKEKLTKVNNFLKDLTGTFHHLDKFVILDNKNIVAEIGNKKISFFEYKNSTYKQFFNNLNKYGSIYNLHKLENNKFLFICQNNEGIAIVSYNEDFTSKIKEIEIEGPIKNLKNNRTFIINNNRLIIVARKNLIIFNLEFFEIETIYEVGQICCVLPFNNINNDKNLYNYFALIIYEEKNFYLKIIRLINTFEETNKINLNEYSSEFEAIIDDNNILNFYNNNYNREIERDFFRLGLLTTNNNETKFFFEMVYDLNDDGKVVLIINFVRSWGNKKLTILLDIDIKKLEFI